MRKNVQIFLDYQAKWSEACCNEYFDKDKYEKLAKEGSECSIWCYNNFTKSDWEELIAQSYGRAKYEYTRLMKQRFPED